MSQKDMRLRLVVCRNSLPDTNVVWSVSLETNPTIAKLLEQVNDIFPLESGEWGLEDYAVELRDASGSSFECLHFQPIRGVLKEDDQVFIRPLFTDDLRRRRVGGRLQISTDGKHLIDGIAFGRPLLKTPRGRPALDIPPRKRRRIAQDEEEEQDEDDEGDGDFEPADDEQMLLLTNGEEESGDEYPSSVRIGALFDNIDADEDDADAEMDDEADDQDFETEGVQQETSEESGSDEDLDDDDMLDGEEEEDLEEELRHLQNESAALGEFEEEPPVAASRASTRRASGLDLKTLDKIGALRAAFPSAPSFVCEKILGNCEGDLKAAYSTLVEGFTPNLPESALMARPQKGAMKVHSEDGEAASSRAAKQKAPGTVSKSSQSKMSAPQPAADDDEEGGSDEEEMEGVPDFVKQFDHKGLPPGSISSGTALKAMAKISGSFRSNQLSGESQATSEALVGSKQGFEAANRNDDDETSSSGTSSSSDDVEEDSDDSDSSDEDVSSGSDEDHEQDDNGASNASEGNSGSGSDSSDDDSSDESDSGPEEITAKDGGFVRTRRSGQADHASSSKGGSEASSSSDDESDVTNDTSSSEESSEDDSSDAESSSASESEKVVAHHSKSRGAAALKGIGQADLAPSKSQSLSMVWTQPTVPPGEGKSSTKSRNARRRALLKAKKLAAQGEEVSVADTSNADTLGTTVAAFTQEDKKQRDKELFEARRQALLDAIANGGVEVGPGSLALEDQSSVSELSNKRKRDGAASTSATEEVTYTQSPVQEGGEVPEAQKRRRIDLGAGRRMLFGALGLRNPKTKEDEEKLRTKLMKDVKPHVNFRLEQEIAADAQDRSTETNGEETSSQQLTEEDPDAWRDKITYRAVECCQEDVELSEPPFPFVQRWDPQQQGVWFHQNQKKNKRGGAGKKRDRNQAHFYQAGTKRKHHESADYDEGELDEDTGYDTTFNRVGEDTTADIELNYDDVEQSTSDKGNDAAEANQLTDVEDLPPLPKDLALLKALLPGEVQKGMVITWKQFVLSKATNWQPQVSDLTGVVVRIDDDATGLQVLLARRDRDLDRTEKSFDDNGRRVYEKFEVPDMEDDEETGEADEVDEMERQGYRTLAFADMMDPKILQAPLHQDDTNNGDESMVRSIEEEVAEAVVADSQPEDVKIADNGQPGAAKEADDGYVDGDTFEGFEGCSGSPSVSPSNPSALDDNHDVVMAHASEAPAPSSQVVEENTALAEVESPAVAVPIELATNFSSTSSYQPGQGPQTITSNFSMSDMSQISSPSRQLHDESSGHSNESGPGKYGVAMTIESGPPQIVNETSGHVAKELKSTSALPSEPATSDQDVVPDSVDDPMYNDIDTNTDQRGTPEALAPADQEANVADDSQLVSTPAPVMSDPDTAQNRLEHSSAPNFDKFDKFHAVGDSGDATLLMGIPQNKYPIVTATPSSASSVRSGRQPDYSNMGDMDTDLGMIEHDLLTQSEENSSQRAEDCQERLDNLDGHGKESVVLGASSQPPPVEEEAEEAEDSQQTPTPGQQVKFESPKREGATPRKELGSSPCSLSSLETVWCTAASSRNTQTRSPSKSQSLPSLFKQNPQKQNDTNEEYEEAMRKLDQVEEEMVEDLSHVPDSYELDPNRVQKGLNTLSSAMDPFVDDAMDDVGGMDNSARLMVKVEKPAEQNPGERQEAFQKRQRERDAARVEEFDQVLDQVSVPTKQLVITKTSAVNSDSDPEVLECADKRLIRESRRTRSEGRRAPRGGEKLHAVTAVARVSPPASSRLRRKPSKVSDLAQSPPPPVKMRTSPPLPRDRNTLSSSQFTVPPGTEIIELLSSGSSPVAPVKHSQPLCKSPQTNPNKRALPRVVSPSPKKRFRKFGTDTNPFVEKAEDQTETNVKSSQEDDAVSEEERFTENYADSDLDGTYSPAQSSKSRLQGSGWISKQNRVGSNTATSRKATVPRSSAPAAAMTDKGTGHETRKVTRQMSTTQFPLGLGSMVQGALGKREGKSRRKSG